jgi:hypothetical protein
LPNLQNPGVYPYVRFEQFRDGSWNRVDETPNNESQAQGHKLGSFEETDNSSGHKHLKVGQSFDYAAQGHTSTVDYNHHNKIGGSTVSQITQDRHEEHGGDKFHAVGGDTIHVSKGYHYSHGTGGISHSSVGDQVSDHNDGNDHHNVEGDKITFIGGIKYENVNSEFGLLVGGNYDILVKGDSQITSHQNMFFNADQYIQINSVVNTNITTANVYANVNYFFMNNISGNTMLVVGNTMTNTMINSTSVVTPSISIGDPVQFVNTTILNVGNLGLSSNGSLGLPGQALVSNGTGTYWTYSSGTNTNVQFNQGNTFNATNAFSFNYVTNTVSISNNLNVSNIIFVGSELIIGNSTVNVVINSTFSYSGGNTSVTNTYLQTLLASYVTNTYFQSVLGLDLSDLDGGTF